MSFWKVWWLAARPKTLTAAVVPVLVGAALAWNKGADFSWSLPALALIRALWIQIATNLVNDVVDFKKGADTENRLGPVRVTQAGLLKPEQVWRGAIFSLLAATIAGLPLVLSGGWPILLIGLLSLFLAYSYTGGPFPLAYLGLGDLFVVMFFGVIPVVGVSWLCQSQWDAEALVLGFQVGLHAAVLIAINNLRDLEGDRAVGKRTLPVLLGIGPARGLIAVYALSPFLIQAYWVGTSGSWLLALPLVTLPLALLLVRQVYRTTPSATYNRFLGWAALLHFGTGLLNALGLSLWQR